MDRIRLTRTILFFFAFTAGLSLAAVTVQAASLQFALNKDRGNSSNLEMIPPTPVLTGTVGVPAEITTTLPLTGSTPIPTNILPTATPAITLTETAVPTVTASLEPTTIITAAVPITPEQITAEVQSGVIITDYLKAYLPLVQYFPPKVVQKKLICSGSIGLSIPDNSVTGISHEISGIKGWYVTDMDVYLSVNHTWVGDTTAWVTHKETGTIVSLFDRPGRTYSSEIGCGQDNIRAIFDDQASITAEDTCGGTPPTSGVSVPGVGGTYLPHRPLSQFFNESFAGTWKLTVFDENIGDTGQVNEWCMEVTLSNYPADPPVPVVPPSLPGSAYVWGMSGEGQHLPLDCESRSAVDWARHFGYEIPELEFFYGLPVSDNPDTGFVGSVWGTWGQIPPNPYGVHAEPIAARLRHYGLKATAVRSMSWDELRYELAHGRPVEVWVIGPAANGWPVYYTPSDGQTTVVAKYEHTVVAVGYDSTYVTILNGSGFYKIPIRRFLESWGVLRNMAVIGK